MAHPIADTSKQDEIKEQLCGCTDDIVICCCGCWCIPCLFGANAQRIDGKNCVLMCLAYTLLVECYLCWIPHFLERQKLRKKYNIKQDDCTDLGVTVCCAPCALCQETREMNRRESMTNLAGGGPIVSQPQAQSQYQPYGSYYPPSNFQSNEQYQPPVQYQPQNYDQPPVQYQPQNYNQPPVQYQPQEQYQQPSLFLSNEQYQAQNQFQPEIQYQIQDQLQPPIQYQPQEQIEPEKPPKPKRPFNLNFNFEPDGGSTAQIHFRPRDQFQPQTQYQSYDSYAQYPPQEQFNNMTL